MSEAHRWQRCLASMRLSAEQQEVVLLSRRAHLHRMSAIYQERQALNMQVGGAGSTPGLAAKSNGAHNQGNCPHDLRPNPAVPRAHVQAMALMLPHAGRDPAGDTTVEGRLASMSRSGYLRVARASAELGDVLDKIKVGFMGTSFRHRVNQVSIDGCTVLYRYRWWYAGHVRVHLLPSRTLKLCCFVSKSNLPGPAPKKEKKLKPWPVAGQPPA
jgi:hypothetical protein